jgi:hypothetical protein
MPLNLYPLILYFCEGSEYAIRTDMRALVLNLLKIVNSATSSRERSKRLWMSQGSILHAQNLNLGPGAKLAKNINFLHAIRKSVIRPRIMQLTAPNCAHNCSKLSRDPLKPCLLKISNTCCMYTSLSKMYGNQVNSNSEPSNHVLIIYLSHVRTNLLLNTNAKLWENLRMPAQIVYASS